MHYVFWDAETTGTATAFDQVLQYGANLTDADFNEIDRFAIRCRLLPWVLPHPGALLTTGVNPAQLVDPALPSHYEMVRAIEAMLIGWSPATFIGYNLMVFDEPLLRQSLFQTLHRPYLKNSQGNTRADVMKLVQACSVDEPGALEIPYRLTHYGSFASMFERHGWPERGSQMMQSVQRRVAETHGSVENFARSHETK